MERNQLTGLLLIFLMLTLYFQFFSPVAPTPEQKKDEKKSEKAVIQRKKALLQAQILPDDSAKRVQILGSFAQVTPTTAKNIVLQNKDLSLQIQTQGGKINLATLKNYNDFFTKKPIELVTNDNNAMSLLVKTAEKRELDIFQLPYTATQKGENEVMMEAKLNEKQYIRQYYTLEKEGFAVKYKIEFVGLEKEIPTAQQARLIWINDMPSVDEDLEQNRYYATINYYTKKDGYNYLTWPSNDPQETAITGEISWVSFKQKFFATAFIASNNNIAQTNIRATTDVENKKIVKTAEADILFNAQDFYNGKANFKLYFGPNDYNALTATKTSGFQYNIYMGWSFVSVFAEYLIIPIFKFCSSFVGNFGLIIILTVLLIKTILLPLTYKSYISMAKMNVLNGIIKPELDAFKEKNSLNRADLTMEEQQKVQAEQMRLYNELGSSPFAALSGCLPLLLQMPILFAMFMFFPNAIEFRHVPFLWAHDLSTYDNILKLPFYLPGFGSHISIFAILMTLSTLLLTYYTAQGQATQQQGAMMYMQYILPVVFLFVMNGYPAGLSFFYLVQNLISLGQQQAIKYTLVDEAKIRKSFEDYKNKPKTEKKKSGFMQMMEEAQRKAKEQQEAKNKK